MEIRFIFINILLFAVFFRFHAQTSGSENENLSKRKIFYEGGVNLYRMDWQSGEYLDFSEANYRSLDLRYNSLQSSFFRGINFKYYNGKNVVRCAFDYLKRTDETRNDPYYQMYAVARATVFSIGYERILVKSRFTPYFFCDLSGIYSEKKGSLTSFMPAIYYPGSEQGDFLFKTRGFVFSPGFGFRYNPLRSLVFNIETHLEYYFLAQKNAGTGDEIYRTWDLRFNPVLLSLGFIF